MINALLVRYGGGWLEVVDPVAVAADGRHEGLLGLGAAGSATEARRVALGEIARGRYPRVEVAADLRPRVVAETPYLGFSVGDTIGSPAVYGSAGAERVKGMTVAEDDDGVLTYAPELADVVLSQGERIEQAIKKMADGTLGGTSKVATPTSAVSASTGKDCCPPQPETPSG